MVIRYFVVDWTYSRFMLYCICTCTIYFFYKQLVVEGSILWSYLLTTQFWTMSDLTPLFKQCVSIVQDKFGDSIKEDYDLKQSRNDNSEDRFIIRDTFIKECIEFHKFLKNKNVVIIGFLAIKRSRPISMHKESAWTGWSRGYFV